MLKRYSQFFSCIAVQATMFTVYPAYNAAFLSLERTGVLQLAFVLLLPIIKFSSKYLLALVQPDDEDLVPALHSSVDIFDALYMTKCMQSVGTLAVGAAIILVDVVQSCIAVRVLANQTQSLQAALRAHHQASGRPSRLYATGPRVLPAEFSNSDPKASQGSLLAFVFSLLEKMHEQVNTQTLRFGSRSFAISIRSEAELGRLRSIHTSSKSSLRGLPGKPKTAKTRQIMASATAVGPSELIPVITAAKITPPPSQQPVELPDSSLSYEATILRETTRLLHESEAVVVVEYVEAVVPVIYAIYISILVRLPNAKYYQDMQQMADDKVHQVVRNILVYALLELLSLVFVTRMLKRSFDISVFYQLALTLESDWRIYQCNFTIWILIIFQFLLLHNARKKQATKRIMAKQLQLLRSKRGSLWEMCIGLEVHAQVLSKSKLMSGSAASTLSSALPNRQVSFFDAALPGTLPVVNKECVHQAIRTSLAVGAQVHARSVFERKHYFYCDLPLGYQLTQQRAPIATNGVLHFDMPASAIVSEHGDAADGDSSGDSNAAVFDASKYKSRKEKNEALRKWKEAQQQKKAKSSSGGDQEDVISRSVRIARIQIEQDSGKSIHDLEEDSTVVDLNRAGTALMEIVMEPDLRSPVEAGQVMKQLQHLLRHLGVCDGNMEEGSMRCDLNVSVRRADDPAFGERVEVKNMNSIRNMMRAAEFEARRQIELLENESDGSDESVEARIHRETRSFDAVTGETKRMRSKEGAKDYRFFPEPDLPPLVVQDEVIQALESTLPELPAALKERLMATYALTPYESSVLVNEAGAAAFFEQVASKQSRPSKLVVNWVLNDLFGHLKAANGDILSSPVSAQELGELIDLIVDGTISGKIAKDVLEILFYDNLAAAGDGGNGADQKTKSPLQIVEEKNWKQIQSDDEIRALCRSVLDDPKTKKNLDAYVNGKTQLFGFFIGQVMKNSGGRVNPELANAVMQELLNEYTASK